MPKVWLAVKITFPICGQEAKDDNLPAMKMAQNIYEGAVNSEAILAGTYIDAETQYRFDPASQLNLLPARDWA